MLRAKPPARMPDYHPERTTAIAEVCAKLGKAPRAIVTIVSPDTFLRRIREEKQSGRKKPTAPRGRPRTPDEIRQLVIVLAKETGWGYTRIGRIKKTGDHGDHP